MTKYEGKMHLRSCIQRVATGPEYSKDLPFDDAYRAMNYILSGEADPVQIAVFLVALRMKRETDEENRGMLKAILENTEITTSNVDEVVDIADAYNGHVRDLPAVPFLPAVLAACGAPACSHGVRSVGPKFGITTYRVLEKAGINVTHSMTESAEKIADPSIGWSYVDQSAYCPKLAALLPLRTTIVKRTALTTLECIIGPVRGKKKTRLYTGYVHKAYPPVYSDLARLAEFDGAIIARGVEGGLIPSLQQPAKIYYFNDDQADQMVELSTKPLGMEHSTRSTPLPADLDVVDVVEAEDVPPFDLDKAVQLTLDAGMAALEGRDGTTKDALIYAAAIYLAHSGKATSLNSGADMARSAIDSGKALKHFLSHCG